MPKGRTGEAAIAQELLNIIRATRSCVDSLLDGGADLAQLEARLLELDHATRRTTQRTHRLVDGREALEDRAPASPAHLIVGMHELLRGVLGPSIDLTVDVVGDVPKVASTPSAVRELFVNLLLNARDAIADSGNVKVSVFSGDERAVIEVRDDGRGFDANMLETATEPFIGTKSDGNGLGLWAAKRIVDDAGGVLVLDSTRGEGTCVRVELPNFRLVNEGLIITADLPRGRVLVVDDDRKVRTSVARTLSKIGYGVEEAADGAEAMALLNDGEEYDLLLTDVVMPVVGGLELVEHARGRSAIAAVYMTGYLDLVLDDAQAAQTLVLSKPFTASELVDTVTEALRPAHTS